MQIVLFDVKVFTFDYSSISLDNTVRIFTPMYSAQYLDVDYYLVIKF